MKIKHKISLLYYACIVSLFTLIAYNIPMFQFAATHSELTIFPKILVLASLAVIMLALNMMLTYLFVYLTRYLGRALIAITLIINALATYFVINYHIIMDDGMISNVFNTRYSEASGYFSWAMVLFVILLGVLPAIWVIWQPVIYETKKKLGIVCGSSLGVIAILLLLNINQTLWISQYDTELGGLTMPWSYIANTFRYADMHDTQTEPEILLPKGEITDTTKTAVVLVIGESARKANFQLYGYKRKTNPLLSKRKDLAVLQAESNGTYTTVGVRAILEPTDERALHEILPNYAERMGVDVAWRTSNWGEPPVKTKEYLNNKALHKQYPNISASEDEILFAGLKDRIESSKKNKVLIILHTSTSHGPDYCRKISKEFVKFKPILNNVEQAEKHPEWLVNAYDNSILYTDYLLNNLIDTLQTMKDYKTAMLFVSDHGESLGEDGIFMHGIPQNMAPKDQYEIPFLVWTSENFRTVKDKKKQIDQHYVFHSVIDLLGIKSPAYDKEKDIFRNEK